MKRNDESHFDNRQVAKWLKKRTLLHELTMPHDDRFNGLMERYNKTFLRVLRCKSHCLQPPQWTQIKIVEGIINTSLHTGVGMTPNKAWNPCVSQRQSLLERRRKLAGKKRRRNLHN